MKEKRGVNPPPDNGPFTTTMTMREALARKMAFHIVAGVTFKIIDNTDNLHIVGKDHVIGQTTAINETTLKQNAIVVDALLGKRSTKS